MKQMIPPQALDLEQSVIGSMLQYPKAVDIALEIIKNPRVFYNNKHKLVFDAIQKLDASNQKVDLLTCSQKLKSLGKLDEVGGDFELINLANKGITSAHTEHHCYILLQHYIKRKIISLGDHAISMGYDVKKDVFQILDSINMEFDKIADIYQNGAKNMDWASAIDEVPKRVERLTNNHGELTGVDTGLDNLNTFFNGWQRSDLIIIGADSGMGKTALAMTNLLASAKQGNPVGMLSMEMSTNQLAIRAVAVESNFHMKQLSHNGFEKNEYFGSLLSVTDSLRSLPIFIDDSPSVTVPEMKRRARYMKRKHNIQLLIVDFIQMFTGDEDDVKLTGLAARELKNLAKELDIPIIALSQLNREVKKAKDNIPSKHHLKNSSGVEEAADVIALLYRPEYYGFSKDNRPDLWADFGFQGEENAVLIVAKNRNGGMGNIPLLYVSNKTKYVNPVSG